VCNRDACLAPRKKKKELTLKPHTRTEISKWGGWGKYDGYLNRNPADIVAQRRLPLGRAAEWGNKVSRLKRSAEKRRERVPGTADGDDGF